MSLYFWAWAFQFACTMGALVGWNLSNREWRKTCDEINRSWSEHRRRVA